MGRYLGQVRRLPGAFLWPPVKKPDCDDETLSAPINHLLFARRRSTYEHIFPKLSPQIRKKTTTGFEGAGLDAFSGTTDVL